jgi:diguanylate cyclase (GGDEF)-like protein/PAS domain S-box-containing protein
MVEPSAILAGKILIVDDQPANVELLDLMLRRAGYLDVTTTMDPTMVAPLHEMNHYDLILLDLHMPGMDGFQVMEALKQIEIESYLPVLVITAQPSQKLRALQAGARDFVGKPFDQSEVLTRIRNMLEVRLLSEECKAHGRHLEEAVRARTADLGRSEEMFRELAANIPEALWIRDVDLNTIRYVNPAWQNLYGLTPTPGDPFDVVYPAIHPDDLQWITHERRKAADTRHGSEYRLVRPDHSVRWVNARSFPIANPVGNTPWLVEILEDVTVRREAQRQLQHLAQHDALTDLPNRSLLYDSLRDALARAAKDGMVVSVLLLDIDYFKSVNDRLGHSIGDAVLREFAARLATCVRPGDTVGRLGGDEFALVVLTREDSHGAAEVAKRIRTALQAPLMLDDQCMMVTASIGIASYPIDTSDRDTLIRYADAAMYEAKASGRDTFRHYTPEMNARAIEKSDIESALRGAQGCGEFVLHYQPKMQIDSGTWTGVEALIRWNRPGHGLVLPGQFTPSLEEMGLIVPVGAWVIDAACRQIRDWERAGVGQIHVAVNVSSRQVGQENFVRDVIDVVRSHRIDPALLEFEITESTLMAHGEPSDVALRKLKDFGISISIDDFGTGYSNLAYLKRFLIDTLKIDITFIQDVTTNADDATIAIAIINMAHSLRLKVVAEGVETREQLEFLRVHGCDEVQGYLLSRPLPADDIAIKLRQFANRDAAPRYAPLAAERSAAHA